MTPSPTERKRLRVLCVTVAPPNTAPASRFRCEAYFPLLEEVGFEIRQWSFFPAREYAAISRLGGLRLGLLLTACFARAALSLSRETFDVVWLCREAAPIGPPILEWILKRRGRPIVYDYDDAIWISPREEGAIARALRFRSKVRRLIRGSVAVIAGNSFLAEYAREPGRNVTVVPTSVDVVDRFGRVKVHEKTRQLVLGWTGSRSTNQYLDIVRGAVISLQADFDFRLSVISDVRPSLDITNLDFHRWTPNDEIDQLLKFDIGLMPLRDSDWERGKCGFKIVQYMACGIPPVASAVGVNPEIIRHGVDGFLCNTEEDWRKYLCILANDPALRSRMGSAARKRIEQHYSIQAHAKSIATILEKAAGNPEKTTASWS